MFESTKSAESVLYSVIQSFPSWRKFMETSDRSLWSANHFISGQDQDHKTKGNTFLLPDFQPLCDNVNMSSIFRGLGKVFSKML